MSANWGFRISEFVNVSERQRPLEVVCTLNALQLCVCVCAISLDSHAGSEQEPANRRMADGRQVLMRGRAETRTSGPREVLVAAIGSTNGMASRSKLLSHGQRARPCAQFRHVSPAAI